MVESHTLPEDFDFYHLGRVTRARETRSFDPAQIVGVTLLGDVQGAVLLVLDRAQDQDTTFELVNIFASRIATRLSQNNNWDVMISPPLALDQNALRRFEQSYPQPIRQQYQHSDQGIWVRMEVCIFWNQTFQAR